MLNVKPDSYENSAIQEPDEFHTDEATGTIHFEGNRALEIEVYPYSNGEETGDIIKIKLKKIK